MKKLFGKNDTLTIDPKKLPVMPPPSPHDILRAAIRDLNRIEAEYEIKFRGVVLKRYVEQNGTDD